jgi:hypothetical protein
MGFLAHSISRKKGQSLFAFVIREQDGALFNNVNLIFQEDQQLHLTLNNVDRAPFRVPYVEIRSGSYRLEIDCAGFEDGAYTIQSRILDNEQESLPIEVTSVNVIGGEQQEGTLNIEAVLASGLNLFVYIRDTFTSKYLFNDFKTFKIFSPIDDLEDIRGNFRHAFVEKEPGKYSLNESLADIEDTVLELGIYHVSEGIEYKAGSPVTVHVHNGKQQRGILFDTILVNQDTISFDHLRYVQPSGDPIADADVYVFRKSEYNADTFDNALGKTTTRSDGRWHSPIPVQAGDTYVVLFFKESAFGPDIQEVVI